MDYIGGDAIRRVRSPGRLKFPAGYTPTDIERIGSVSEGTCLSILNDVVIPNLSSEVPNFEGTGVVTCAGGRYLKLAYASIRKLREVSPEIPVQIWYIGAHEIDGFRYKFDGLGVEFRDVQPIFESEFYRHRTGWSAKSVAVMHSPFENTVFLDADAYPILPVDEIIAHSDFEYGALFFPDGKVCRDSNRVFNALGIKYDESFQEWEAGQFACSKSRHWKALQLYAWFNKHGYLFHELTFGDKEGFPLACLKLGEKFKTGNSPTWEEWGYQHYLTDGTPAFHHVLHTKRHGDVAPPAGIAELWEEFDAL